MYRVEGLTWNPCILKEDWMRGLSLPLGTLDIVEHCEIVPDAS